ncbi:hypothetical protein NX059_003633 [Plenodomus lindquistii]|nr:hypothetical protein NX059_003633 [Plenodomus lindquistii]
MTLIPHYEEVPLSSNATPSRYPKQLVTVPLRDDGLLSLEHPQSILSRCTYLTTPISPSTTNPYPSATTNSKLLILLPAETRHTIFSYALGGTIILCGEKQAPKTWSNRPTPTTNKIPRIYKADIEHALSHIYRQICNGMEAAHIRTLARESEKYITERDQDTERDLRSETCRQGGRIQEHD